MHKMHKNVMKSEKLTVTLSQEALCFLKPKGGSITINPMGLA